jgi:hypothetical protein
LPVPTPGVVEVTNSVSGRAASTSMESRKEMLRVDRVNSLHGAEPYLTPHAAFRWAWVTSAWRKS